MGRLKDGVSENAAKSQLNGIFRGLVLTDGSRHPLEIVTTPGRRGFYALNARDTNALWILMLLVAILMLIVCANVANLLLARSVSRHRESALRLALGAGRMRVFRQHLIESAVLAILGGTAGLAFGYVIAQTIHLVFQTGRDASNAFDLRIDLRVLLYTGGLCALTSLLFGLAPALQAARNDLNEALKANAKSVVGGSMRLPRMLVSIQLALCLGALVSAGLLGRTLGNLKWAEVGFDRHNLAYVTVSLSWAGYSVERFAPYADRVRDELRRTPGVLEASTVSTRPLSGGGNNGRVNFPGRPWDDASRSNLNTVSDRFFETMRIPLRAGRTIERKDMRPDAQAIVIDEAFAQRYYPNENPLGRRFGMDPKNNNSYEIVGIVGNTGYNSLRNNGYPTVYLPYKPGGTIHFAIRSTMDSVLLAEAVRKVLAAVDPTVPVTEFHTQTGLIDRMLRTERLLGFVSGAFGVIALTLAAIGLGGLLAYAVARRTREIGVRVAVGASGGDVTRLILGDSLRMLMAGLVIGLPAAFAIARMLKPALFATDPLDPATAVLSTLALMGVALMAAWIPARRAANIDPVKALRDE